MRSYDPNDLAAFARLYDSVSKRPEPINHAEVLELTRDLQRSLEGGPRVRVLLSIAVDATGRVESVRAVQPPSLPRVHTRAVLMSKDGQETTLPEETSTDPRVVAAAESIGRALRFRPAERDGMAVPFPDFRMSISFGGR